ncbi:MAG: asparagine synthetase B family protein [Rhodocyclaceae bacterium]
MSFIAGVIGSFSQSEAGTIVERMAQAMAYRGGNAKQIISIQDNAFSMAMTGSHCHPDAAARTFLAMEGEIYAIPGNDNPATEAPQSALIRQYQQAGSDFPRSVNGAYTAVLWDENNQTLHLARDHAGCRSVYYAPIDGGIVFASTAAAIVATGIVDASIDPASVDCYFGVKALSPPRTMFKHIFAVRPGHALVWKDGQIRQHDYWRLHEVREDQRSSAAALRDELRATIEDAVRIRQRAGGNFCALVSGGIDTSAVATLLSRSSGSPQPLHGLSIAFDEMAYSDASLQDIIVKTLGVDQHERILKPADFAATLTRAVGFLDSPVNDAALVGMHAVFGMAREDGYDVVFDGEGPDELFPAGNTQGERGIAGLLRMPQPLRRATFGLLADTLPIGDSMTDRIRRMCARLALPDDERRMTWRPLFHTAVRRQLLSAEYRSGADPYAVGKEYLGRATLDDPLNLYQYGLIKTFLPDDLLYKNERMASAHNVMNRTPLVDYRLIELALRTPSRYQIAPPTPQTDGIKLLYKEALRGIVPDGILDRRKERGFSQPTKVWFAGQLKDFLHENILGTRALGRGIFNRAFLQRLFDEHAAGRANHDAHLTSVLIFNLWMDTQEYAGKVS